MILHSLNLVGDGSVHTLAEYVSGYVAGNAGPGGKFVQVLTGGSNAGNARIGGSEVSSTVGFPLIKGFFGQILPPISELMEYYDFTKIYVYLALNDTLDVLYGG